MKRVRGVESASRKKFEFERSCVFVLPAQVREVHQEKPSDYNESASGRTIYTYVNGNPISNIDPLSLDTYVASRDLASFGTSARPLWDPLTHTFTFSTNPDGSIASTYSWGDAANLQGWNLNQPEDMKATAEALQKGVARKVAPAFVDPYYRKAFDQLNNPKNNHYNGVVFNNCKDETAKLNDLAWKLLGFQ